MIKKISEELQVGDVIDCIISNQPAGIISRIELYPELFVPEGWQGLIYTKEGYVLSMWKNQQWNVLKSI